MLIWRILYGRVSGGDNDGDVSGTGQRHPFPDLNWMSAILIASSRACLFLFVTGKLRIMICDMPEIKGVNPVTGVDSRDSIMCTDLAYYK